MKTSRLLTILLLFASPLVASAAETAQSDADCAALLERWATDPKAAPKAVINACKDQLAQAAALPVAEPAQIAAADPCTGPGAADSVLCWGPWASVAPAAGFRDDPAQPPVPQREICDARTEQCQPLVAVVPPDPPLGSCAPGTPCGFATVVAGISSSDDPEDTSFARFDMAANGSQFTVSPEDGTEINSVSGMRTSVEHRNDGYENMRSTGRAGDEQSRITARVVRDDEDQVLLAADVWSHGNRANQTSQSGYFAWGTATSQSGLDALNSGNVSVNFSGPMSVDNHTMASMTVDFGSNPTWTGTWTNPGYSFGAGGVVSGADMISLPGQFTENVVADQSFVQGVLLGESGGARGIAHIIDVTLSDQGRIKDVGLLRDVVA
ncbi:MAG: hypothetical protein FJ170_03490, partial [Gammaproteobacteria bacterium]|nr:hypothetical protein [Gammaproteobacteria bacterium]